MTSISIPAILFTEIYSTYKVASLDIITQNDLVATYLTSGCIFCYLGFGFLVYGLMTIWTLKQHFKPFYTENFCVLIFATTSLFLPLMARGILNLLNALNTRFAAWVIYQRINFEAITYIVGTVIPIMSQLSTLIFGHIRKRKNEKYQLLVTKDDIDETADFDESMTSSHGETTNDRSSVMAPEAFDFFVPQLMEEPEMIPDSGNDADNSDNTRLFNSMKKPKRNGKMSLEPNQNS